MRLLSLVSAVLMLLAWQTPSNATTPPCSCLQELWVDYPGPYDLYFSLNHYSNCYDTPDEGLWYGWPNNYTLPQSCADDECEEYEETPNRSAALFPGHGQNLVGTKAWEIFRTGLDSAVRKMPGLEFGPPAYHVIPQKSLPAKLNATQDMVVMAIPINVHVKGSRFDGKNYYLCVQMDTADGLQITKATFEDAKPGLGSQFQVKIRTQNGEVRKGLVWLK